MIEIKEIIEGCKKHDRLSQEKLYRQFYPALFALCRTFFKDEQDIITVLNNGMLRVFKSIEQFNPEKGTLFNWTYTIIRNSAITELRKIKDESSNLVYTETLPDTFSENPFEEKDWEYIYLLLEKLPAMTRAVCSLYYLEGFLIKEIASQLELKEGTVKWHLNESRNRLKHLLQSQIKEIE